jgi:hypothetical protein
VQGPAVGLQVCKVEQGQQGHKVLFYRILIDQWLERTAGLRQWWLNSSLAVLTKGGWPGAATETVAALPTVAAAAAMNT